MMSSLLLCFLTLGIFSDPDPTLHDLPDGVVKISTQVIVELDKTHIRYDVGFNPKTLNQLYEKYVQNGKKDLSPGEKLKAFRQAFRKNVLKSLKLKAGDQAVQANDEVLAEPDEISKHVQARFHLEFDLPIRKETRIEILDSSFQSFGRICNSGFKTAGTVAVKESSTRAIPIRSKPTEKEAEEAEPFVISGTVFKLAVSIGDDSSSGAMAPVFVLALALGSAFATGFSLVPSDGGEDDHEDHH